MLRRIHLLITTLCCMLRLPASVNALEVSEDGRYFELNDRPFLWLGDTAWELFHRLNREEADLYLQTRAAQGFNVIQAVVLAERDGLADPNPYGDLPLADLDPARPNDAYFKHVDYIVQRAEELGLIIGMLPTWGDKWNRGQGIGPEVFTPQNAEVFGEYIGRRYRKAPIVWILGGDRTPAEEKHFAITRAMAHGLKKGDGGAHLVTFHPGSECDSAHYFHADDWLDFNMFQSGHSQYDFQNYKMTLAVAEQTPVKPVIDSEPCYEDHPICWRPDNGWFDAFDSRRAGYWSMLSGAAGHTYGHHSIWQMWQPGRESVSSARTPWREALHYPGAYHAGFMRRFFESLSWWKLQPAMELLKKPPTEAGRDTLAAATADGSCILVYTPFGQTIEINQEELPAGPVSVRWFDPRLGNYIDCGTFGSSPTVFDPPADPKRGNDWMLVIERRE